MRRGPSYALIPLVLAVAVLLTSCRADSGTTPPPAPAASRAPATLLTSGPGPRPDVDCQFNLDIDAFVGADGTASAIGWEGNHQGIVTCLGGTFLVQDGIFRDYGFGVYDGGPTTWTDADGYLPEQITTFRHGAATVTVTEFADRVVIGGHPFVAVYSRVKITNPTARVLVVDPEPTSGMVMLDSAADSVPPHASVAHDYVVVADRFGATYPWPTPAALAGAGSFDAHEAHMRGFWNQQLSQIAGVAVPDASLDDAYRAGFIFTQIARSGDDLDTGVNGYEGEFSHDVVGILTNLFTQGYFSDAHALLLEARDVVGSEGQYVDGLWTYALPWAVYLMKTGDRRFVEENFVSAGPMGVAQPSIEAAAHTIAADRTGPGGIMEATDDIDTQGYWTTDDYEALLGLAAYRYLAQSIGNGTEAAWATDQYDSLLSSVDAALQTTLSRYQLGYLPCSVLEPDTEDRCADPEDANWASPLGSWAWEGSLLGATISGPGASMIDATYDYGFQRLQGRLPPDTFGGYPDDYYTSGYNAAYGTAGLASSAHRDQGILGYEFMIENGQSGPNSWWESSAAPSTDGPWTGSHPAAGQGSSPHAWGLAGADKVLLDSLVAQRADGTLIVGRGVPSSWLADGDVITVTNFPAAGRRVTLRIASHGRSVSLSVTGRSPSQEILFELPIFVDDVSSVSAGTVDEGTGTVVISPRVRSATVELERAPGH